MSIAGFEVGRGYIESITAFSIEKSVSDLTHQPNLFSVRCLLEKQSQDQSCLILPGFRPTINEMGNFYQIEANILTAKYCTL
jgi:hypothetical protein